MNIKNTPVPTIPETNDRKWKKKERREITLRFPVTITSPEHFERIVRALKVRVGKKGVDWTFPGKIRKHLKTASQKKPLVRTVHVFVENPPENLEFLFKLME